MLRNILYYIYQNMKLGNIYNERQKLNLLKKKKEEKNDRYINIIILIINAYANEFTFDE